MSELLAPAELAVYIHWPFCKAKCPYCDFNSHVRHAAVDSIAFAQALARELTSFAALAHRRKVASVFFGGGTPSLMPPAAVAHVLEAVARLWQLDERVEITLEANPTSADAQNFRDYRSSGVNRLSLGVQALNDADLRALGRLHTAEEAVAAFHLAARIFPRLSLDLIYARPAQSLEQWRDELSEALAIQQGHMSLYQLTIEPGTLFHDLYRKGALVLPSEEQSAALFELTQELTSAHGLAAYEISNHARPGHESRHNLAYWRYADYIGVGPGAHSRLSLAGGKRLAFATERHPETWLQLVQSKGHGRIEQSELSSREQGLEMLLMGLRLKEGVDLDRYHRLSGRNLDERTMVQLAEAGLLARGESSRFIRATPSGRRVLDALISALAPAD
jgi:putative oxygen-independent coproporphyrinogen III oxidase